MNPTIAVTIGVICLAVYLTAKSMHEAFLAHTRRYGFLPVVFRWFSGRQRHGLEGDDRRRDDRYDPQSRHYHATERWLRGGMRTTFVFGWPVLGLAWVLGYWKLWLLAFILLGGYVACYLLRLTARKKLSWGWAKWRPHVSYNKRSPSAMLNPLHKRLHDIVGHSRAIKPYHWIRVLPDDKGVELTLPKNWNGSEADRKKIVATTQETMGLHPSSYAEWRLGAGEASVRINDHSNPPDHVTIADIQAQIDKEGQDAVVLGIGRAEKPVSVSMAEDSPHFGLSIGSGGGKSRMARLIASQVLHNGGIVLILDIKRVSHAWARDLPNVRYARSVEEIHEALVWLAWEVERRTLKADDGTDVEGEILVNVGPRLLVLVEELNETSSRLRRYWAETRGRNESKKSPAIDALEGALFMGRQVRVNMIAVAQMMTAIAAGSGAARENMGVRILGRYTRNNWRMLVPEFDMPAKSNRPGRIQVVTHEVRECQVADMTGAAARSLALSGIVTAFPKLIQGHPEPKDHELPVPADSSPVHAEESKDVTLQEAIAQGYTDKDIRALRNARFRDAQFPKPTGERTEEHGSPKTYNSLEIAAWSKKRR